MSNSAEVPAGTEFRRFKRLTSLHGRAMQFISAFLFASYLYFGPVGALLFWGFACYFDLSFVTCGVIMGAYILQLLLFRPHMRQGFYPILLYNTLCDYVLHYYDGTCVREGPAPDPSGRYLFAVFPHGIFGVCRAFSGGIANWMTLYPGITAKWGSFGAAFYIPGIREFSLASGCIDASKPVLTRAIQKYKQNILLLPGGIDEMALTDGSSKDTKLLLVDRKGFSKLVIFMIYSK